jgi:GPI mannosyltransferase 3
MARPKHTAGHSKRTKRPTTLNTPRQTPAFETKTVARDHALLAPSRSQSRTPWLAIALLGLPPALIAVLQLGVLHPDEVYQALEPAHYFAFGRGLLLWEWQQGLRNWAVPAAFGWLLKACATLGIDDAQLRRAVIEVPQYTLHVLALCEVYRLLRRRMPRLPEPSAWRDRALWGVALIGLYAPVLHFAGRTMSESYSTSLLILGLGRIDARGRPDREYVLAGLWLGLAVVARYGSAVIAIAALLWLVVARRSRDATRVAAGGAIAACFLGLLDWRSWGAPFHSLVHYMQFNVLSDRAAAFGAYPFWFYVPWLLLAAPLWIWPAALARFRCRGSLALTRETDDALPAGPIASCAGAYLLAISCVAHKEPRFLYPALVLFAVAAAPSWVAISNRSGARAAPWLGVSLALGLPLLVLDTPFRPAQTTEFRMFVKAARGGTGVVLLHPGPETMETPGQFYAATKPWQLCRTHRGDCLRTAIEDPRFNRVVGRQRQGARQLGAHGFGLAEQRAGITLWTRPAPELVRAGTPRNDTR